MSQKLGEPEPKTGGGEVAPDFASRFGEALSFVWNLVTAPMMSSTIYTATDMPERL